MAKKTSTRQPLPADPVARFKAVANRRVNNALTAISSIGAITGPGYTYEDAEAVKIIDALTKSVGDLQARLTARSKVKSGGFVA